LDLRAFDPATDKDLAGQFSLDTLEKRAANHRELQRRVGLPLDASIPILAMVGRLDIQKGLDIALQALETLPAHAWRLIVLGSGDAGIETLIRNMEKQFPDRVRGIFRYDAPLSRLIYGGADILLMPSRYEPCGLAQMIAMHYGCIPVVRATGGLKDTVHENKTGFLFHEAEPQAMQKAILQALDDYSNKEKWQIYQRNGMQEDFSWARSARQYAIIYKSLMAVR
jgi:starch synthase